MRFPLVPPNPRQRQRRLTCAAFGLFCPCLAIPIPVLPKSPETFRKYSIVKDFTNRQSLDMIDVSTAGTRNIPNRKCCRLAGDGYPPQWKHRSVNCLHTQKTAVRHHTSGVVDRMRPCPAQSDSATQAASESSPRNHARAFRVNEQRSSQPI